MSKYLNEIKKHIINQGISEKQIAKDIGIDINTVNNLSSDDFLKLCRYLRIKPEHLFDNDTVRL